MVFNRIPIGAFLSILYRPAACCCKLGPHFRRASRVLKQNVGVWLTEAVGLRISSIASSSLGHRKKGYPKRQAIWEPTLASNRRPIDFAFLFHLARFCQVLFRCSCLFSGFFLSEPSVRFKQNVVASEIKEKSN